MAAAALSSQKTTCTSYEAVYNVNNECCNWMNTSLLT